MLDNYSTFIYKDYRVLEDDEKIYFEFDFEIENLSCFNHKIEILKKDFKWKNLKSNILQAIIFNLGMVEAISYFKLVCPKHFVIKCGYLNEEQKQWFRKLYYLGLGEFRYKNNITTLEEQFVEFDSLGRELKLEELNLNLDGILLPIGGGKDSCVTSELLKSNFKLINPFRVSTNEVAIKCIEASGFERKDTIEITRKIDKRLLELNEKGFLNGHTPFSAMIAFLSFSVAFMLERKYIVLSNEDSANETNISGVNINHQYSKTLEFENDFREYVKKFFRINIEYFSFLRPISELQIAMIFSRFEKYHNVFKSCNVGSKNIPWIWCGNCPKCLFVYIIMSAFLEEEKLIQIFGANLFENENLLNTFIELCGYGEIKPFECVGTFDEVRFCINKNIEKRKGKNLPFLLEFYEKNYSLETVNDDRLKYFSDNNNLPLEFEKILRENI